MIIKLPRLPQKSKDWLSRGMYLAWLVILVWGLYNFYTFEPSHLLKIIFLGLLIWALILAQQKQREFLVLLSGFLSFILVYDWLERPMFVSWLVTLGYLAINLILFYVFHYQVFGRQKTWQLPELIYACLGLLVMVEFFLVLEFFPVDPKNKAILLMLTFWYYNQIYGFLASQKLTRPVIINLTLAFLLIFGVIVFSLPFLGR